MFARTRRYSSSLSGRGVGLGGSSLYCTNRPNMLTQGLATSCIRLRAKRLWKGCDTKIWKTAAGIIYAWLPQKAWRQMPTTTDLHRNGDQIDHLDMHLSENLLANMTQNTSTTFSVTVSEKKILIARS